jgi:uncharacterized protein
MDGSPRSYHEFPLTFSLRVMGEDRDDFAGLVFELISPHASDLQREHLTARPSRQGRYLSITVTFQAHSKAQLDEIYRALSANPRVLMVL